MWIYRISRGGHWRSYILRGGRETTTYHEKPARQTRCLYRGLGFGQIHWNINCPIPKMLMTTAVCRQSGGDCLPQILGSSTSCQVEQRWLPNITTYFCLAYARTASKEQARFSAKRTDWFRLAACNSQEYKQYGMAWEMLQCPSGIPDLASSNFSIFRLPKRPIGCQKFEQNSGLRKKVVLPDVSEGFLRLNLLSSQVVQF
jgi:hypothetical protein